MTDHQPSDLQKAVENVKPTDLAKNLENTDNPEQPQNLDKTQTIPFIDESVRTDK